MAASAGGADLGPHGDEVTAPVYEARGGLVAAALRAGPILVWDLKTRRQLFQLRGHGRATLALTVTPKGDLLSGDTMARSTCGISRDRAVISGGGRLRGHHA